MTTRRNLLSLGLTGAALALSPFPPTQAQAQTQSIGAIRVAPAGVSGNESTVLTGGVTLAADSTISVADRSSQRA